MLNLTGFSEEAWLQVWEPEAVCASVSYLRTTAGGAVDQIPMGAVVPTFPPLYFAATEKLFTQKSYVHDDIETFPT